MSSAENKNIDILGLLLVDAATFRDRGDYTGFFTAMHIVMHATPAHDPRWEIICEMLDDAAKEAPDYPAAPLLLCLASTKYQFYSQAAEYFMRAHNLFERGAKMTPDLSVLFTECAYKIFGENKTQEMAQLFDGQPAPPPQVSWVVLKEVMENYPYPRLSQKVFPIYALN